MLIGGIVGAAIGQSKSRTFAGALAGAVLGVIGWLLIAVGPDMGRKCTECRATIVQDARRCQHCGSEQASRAGSLT